MRGRKNPTTSQSPPNLPPCKVCGEQGTGFHYGVTTCGACKGFFRRSLVRKEPYQCVGSGSCRIGPETKRRKSCPKCRHDKCLDVGMSKDAIKTGRYSYVKKSHDIMEMIEHHFQHFLNDKEISKKTGSTQTDVEDADFSQTNGKQNQTTALSSSPRDDTIAQVKNTRPSCALETGPVDIIKQPSNSFMELSPAKSDSNPRDIFCFDNIVPEEDSSLHLEVIKDYDLTATMVTEMDAGMSQHDLIGSFEDYPPMHNNEEVFGHWNSLTSLGSSPSASSAASMSDASVSPEYFNLLTSHSSGHYQTTAKQFSSAKRKLNFELLEPKSFSFDLPQDFTDLDELNLHSDTIQTPRYYQREPVADELGLQAKANIPESNSCNGREPVYHKNIISKSDAEFCYQSSEDRTLLYYPTICSMTPPESPMWMQKRNPQQIFETIDKELAWQPFTDSFTPVSNELKRLRYNSMDNSTFDDNFLTHSGNFLVDDLASQGRESESYNLPSISSFISSRARIVTETEVSDGDTLQHWSYCEVPERFQEGVNSCSEGMSTFSGGDSVPHFQNYPESKADGNPFEARVLSHHADQTEYIAELVTVTGESKSFNDLTSTAQFQQGTVHFQDRSSQHSPRNLSKNAKTYQGDGVGDLVSKNYLSMNTSEACAEPMDRPILCKFNENTSTCANFVPENSESALSSPTTSEEPINFLYPLPISSSTRESEQTQGEVKTSSNSDDISESKQHKTNNVKFPCAAESNSISSKKTPCSDEDILRKWTPFGINDEMLRLKNTNDDFNQTDARVYTDDADYQLKPLPFCEFTEADLDKIVVSLKTSYQKYIGVDSNMLSDEEIIDKEEAFLSIMKSKEKDFGTTFCTLENDLYFQIFEATGIDVDGRKEMTEAMSMILDKNLHKTVKFFRSVPGFQDVCHEDKLLLVKSCIPEYTMLGSFRGINPEKKLILDVEHKIAYSTATFEGLVPEWEGHVQDVFTLATKLKDLKLSFEEILVLKAISLTTPDREKLKEFDKVDAVYWRLHCCLLLNLWRRHSSPLQHYARVITVLTELRSLTQNGQRIMRSAKPDILKLTKQVEVPLYLELFVTGPDIQQ